MKELPLTRGYSALVDDDVEAWLGGLIWSAVERVAGGGKVYARRVVRSRVVYLHRMISGVPNFFWVGFRNGNGLDNRRANLIVEDMHGRDIGCQGGGGYIGVIWDSGLGLWRAEIGGLVIGHWVSEADAARAYNAKALELYPADEHIRLNRIEYLSESVGYSMPEVGEGRRRDRRHRGYYEGQDGRYTVDIRVDGKRRVRRVITDNERVAAEAATLVYRDYDAMERVI